MIGQSALESPGPSQCAGGRNVSICEGNYHLKPQKNSEYEPGELGRECWEEGEKEERKNIL